MSLLMTLPIQAASPKSGWQEVTSEEITLSNGQNTTRLPSTVKSGDPIEVYSNDGFIYIRTPKRVQVQVFTILGQLVSQAYINPGTSQLKIETRGIYIVKDRICYPKSRIITIFINLQNLSTKHFRFIKNYSGKQGC